MKKKKLINIILFLKLITNQKPLITKSKKNIIFLKIKKNSIIGCKITLRKKNIFFFLEKVLIFILPNLTKIKINFKNQNIFNFKINSGCAAQPRLRISHSGKIAPQTVGLGFFCYIAVKYKAC